MKYLHFVEEDILVKVDFDSVVVNSFADEEEGNTFPILNYHYRKYYFKNHYSDSLTVEEILECIRFFHFLDCKERMYLAYTNLINTISKRNYRVEKRNTHYENGVKYLKFKKIISEFKNDDFYVELKIIGKFLICDNETKTIDINSELASLLALYPEILTPFILLFDKKYIIENMMYHGVYRPFTFRFFEMIGNSPKKTSLFSKREVDPFVEKITGIVIELVNSLNIEEEKEYSIGCDFDYLRNFELSLLGALCKSLNSERGEIRECALSLLRKKWCFHFYHFFDDRNWEWYPIDEENNHVLRIDNSIKQLLDSVISLYGREDGVYPRIHIFNYEEASFFENIFVHEGDDEDCEGEVIDKVKLRSNEENGQIYFIKCG